MLRLVLVWPVLFGLYLLLAGSLGGTELIAGCAVATAGALFTVGLRKVGHRRYGVPPGWPSVVVSSLSAVPIETVQVGLVLLRTLYRPPAGAIGAVSARSFPATGDAPPTAARRGLETLGRSLSPNGYVLSVGDRALGLHRLAHGDD